MCIDCYEHEYDAPKIYNDKVQKAVELIEQIYDFHSAGGGLHIVLDDWNLEQHHIDYCEVYICTEKDSFSPEFFRVQLDCVSLFDEMSLDERASALGLAYGFWERNQDESSC